MVDAQRQGWKSQHLEQSGSIFRISSTEKKKNFIRKKIEYGYYRYSKNKDKLKAIGISENAIYGDKCVDKTPIKLFISMFIIETNESINPII